MRTMGHLALAFVIGVCTISCREENRADAEVRTGAEPRGVTIDSGEVEQKIEEGAEKVRRSEPAQDLKQGAEQLGRGIAGGAGKIVEKAGEAIEGAGKKIAPADEPQAAPDGGR